MRPAPAAVLAATTSRLRSTESPGRRSNALPVLAVALAVLAGAAMASPALRAGGHDGARPAAGAVPELGSPAALAFVGGNGQLRDGAEFRARAAGYEVLLAHGTASVTTSGGDRFTLAVEGARPGVTGVGRDPVAGRVRSYTGGDAGLGGEGRTSFGTVTYPGIVAGVDLVFYGRGPHLEYDLVVAPGVDPSGITMRVTRKGEPGRPLATDGSGALVLGSSGAPRFLAPEIYQRAGDGGFTAVEGSYDLRGPGRFGFAVGSYDRTRPLVIDPVLVSGSYLGGSSRDTAYDVAVDADGNAVVVGFTESTDFPNTGGVQADLAQHPEGTRTDMFVTKVGSDGAIQWSTYLGGRGTDAAVGVDFGPDGSVYVVGYSDSTDFPIAGSPYQGENAGAGTDVVVAKLRADGELDFTTYVGGNGNDVGNGIVVDDAGAAYVVGSTGSVDFPVANAAYSDLSGSDDVDGFVFKLAASGSELVYSTYLGGPADDHAVGVAVDSSGAAYVTGDTRSLAFPTVEPFQAVSGGAGTGLGSTFADAFVTKVAPDGRSLVYSTYLGGADSDTGADIAVDPEGSAYVTGNTGSANFPVLNAVQERKDGDFDAFVTKLDPTGSAIVYSTYVGGNQSDGAEGIAVDTSGNAWVVGSTGSSNLPSVEPVQGARGGGAFDAFVVQLNRQGSEFLAASYIGGRDEDRGAGLQIAPSGNVWIAGYTNAPDFPLARPFQEARGGGVGDAFVVELVPEVVGQVPVDTPPAAAERDGRVRLWVSVAAGLFGLAFLQSIFLRVRDRRAKPNARHPQAKDSPIGEPEDPSGSDAYRAGSPSDGDLRLPGASSPASGSGSGGGVDLGSPPEDAGMAPNGPSSLPRRGPASGAGSSGSLPAAVAPTGPPGGRHPTDPAEPQPALSGSSPGGDHRAGRPTVRPDEPAGARSADLQSDDLWAVPRLDEDTVAAARLAPARPEPSLRPPAQRDPLLDGVLGDLADDDAWFKPRAPSQGGQPEPATQMSGSDQGPASSSGPRAGRSAPPPQAASRDTGAAPRPTPPPDRGGSDPSPRVAPTNREPSPPPAQAPPAQAPPAQPSSAQPSSAQPSSGPSSPAPASGGRSPSAGSGNQAPIPPSPATRQVPSNAPTIKAHQAGTARVSDLAAAAAADLAAAAAPERVEQRDGRKPDSIGGRAAQDWTPLPAAPLAPLAPAGPDERAELSLNELLSEDLPIPEGGALEDEFSVADLLDEEMAGPGDTPSGARRRAARRPVRADSGSGGPFDELQGGAAARGAGSPGRHPGGSAADQDAAGSGRGGSEPPPQPPAAEVRPRAGSPQPAAMPQAERGAQPAERGAQPAEPVEPPVAGPPPPPMTGPGKRPYGDLFTPDPDDPLVQATLAAQQDDDDEDAAKKGRRRRR